MMEDPSKRKRHQTIFQLQKISNHGTSNPIVARLSIQTNELLKWMDVEKDKRDTIFDEYRTAQKRLLQCFEAVERLKVSRHAAEELSFLDGPSSRVRAVPYLIGMQEESETFLLSAKQYIRQLVVIFNVLFDANLKEDAASFWDKSGKGECAAFQWAKTQKGAKHPLCYLLREDEPWIGEVVRKRNATEHPDGWSGNLIFENYRSEGDAVNTPRWRRDGRQPSPESDLFMDMDGNLSRMLEIAENLLVIAVLERPMFPFLRLSEIDETQRNPSMPIRYELVPNIPIEPRR